MAAWMLHGACLGEEAGARNLVFLPVKWLQPAMFGTSCAAVAVWIVSRSLGSSSVFWSEWIQIALAAWWEELTWKEMRWSVEWEVKWEVRGVKSAVWSVKKVFAWRCIAPGSRAGHVLGQQHRNSFAQSTDARAWLAHGACKFYRWERSYSRSLRQLPPRLVQVLPVIIELYSRIIPRSSLLTRLFTKSRFLG